MRKEKEEEKARKKKEAEEEEVRKKKEAEEEAQQQLLAEVDDGGGGSKDGGVVEEEDPTWAGILPAIFGPKRIPRLKPDQHHQYQLPLGMEGEDIEDMNFQCPMSDSDKDVVEDGEVVETFLSPSPEWRTRQLLNLSVVQWFVETLTIFHNIQPLTQDEAEL